MLNVYLFFFWHESGYQMNVYWEWPLLMAESALLYVKCTVWLTQGPREMLETQVRWWSPCGLDLKVESWKEKSVFSHLWPIICERQRHSFFKIDFSIISSSCGWCGWRVTVCKILLRAESSCPIDFPSWIWHWGINWGLDWGHGI